MKTAYDEKKKVVYTNPMAEEILNRKWHLNTTIFAYKKNTCPLSSWNSHHFDMVADRKLSQAYGLIGAFLALVACAVLGTRKALSRRPEPLEVLDVYIGSLGEVLPRLRGGAKKHIIKKSELDGALEEVGSVLVRLWKHHYDQNDGVDDDEVMQALETLRKLHTKNDLGDDTDELAQLGMSDPCGNESGVEYDGYAATFDGGVWWHITDDDEWWYYDPIAELWREWVDEEDDEDDEDDDHEDDDASDECYIVESD